MVRIVNSIVFVIFASLNLAAQTSSQIRLADSLKNSGDYQKAVSIYSNILQKAEHRGSNSMLIHSYNGRAFCYKKQAQYSLALADYDKAINLTAFTHDNKDMYSLYANKSDLLIQMAAYDDAELFLKSIPSDIKDSKIQLVKAANLSAIYLYQGKAEQCIELLDSIIPLITDKKERRIAYQNRAIAYTTITNPNYYSNSAARSNPEKNGRNFAGAFFR